MEQEQLVLMQAAWQVEVCEEKKDLGEHHQ